MTSEPMLLSGMTAKGNLHLHAAAERRSHRERVSGVSTETPHTIQTKGLILAVCPLGDALCSSEQKDSACAESK